METYYPTSWVILKINVPDVPSCFKVLAGFKGDTFLSNDEWRINSGITKVEKKGGLYHFYGQSGNCYVCNESDYRVSNETAPVLRMIFDRYKTDVEVVDAKTDWLNLL
jgi:hypothetical protein